MLRELSLAERLASSDLAEAHRILISLLEQSNPELSLEGRARAHGLLAEVLCDLGDLGAAHHAIQTARREWLIAGLELGVFQTDVVLARILHEFGENEHSIATSHRLLNKLSAVPHSRGDLAYRASLGVQANTNLGNSCMRLGEYSDAKRHYDIAANLCATINDHDRRVQSIANCALADVKLGMSHRALEGLSFAEKSLTESGLSIAAARCVRGIAECLLSLDRVGEAIDRLEDARTTFEGLHATADVARCVLLLSRTFHHAGMPYEARSQALVAKRMFDDVAAVDESAQAMLMLGVTSMALGNLDEACLEIDAAERIFLDRKNGNYRSRALLTKAKLARLSGDRVLARSIAEDAYNRIVELKQMSLAPEALLLLAEVAPNLAEAASRLDKASQIIEGLDIVLLRFAYEQSLAHHQLRSGRPKAAAETLRLCLTKAYVSHSCTSGIRRRVAQASTTIQASDELIRILLDLDRHSSVIEAWQWASVAKSLVLQDITKSKSSNLGAPQEPTDFSLPPVPKGPILQYQVLGNEILVFVICDGQVTCHRLESSVTDVRAMVDAWHSECARMSRARSDRNPDPGHRLNGADDILTELNYMLIEPLEDSIAHLVGDRLLIIPDQFLFSVPFEALHDEEVSLFSRFRLSFTTGLVLDRSFPSSHEVAEARPVIALALPDTDAPRILDEANVVAELRPDAVVHIGADATIERLTTLHNPNSIIHLACHGVFFNDDPFSSWLQLSDGRMSAIEISELDLRGALVILNACSSGQSSDKVIEPVGLVWAFLAAGCHAVIAAKWAIDDEVSVHFTRSFYTHLSTGAPLDEVVDRTRQDIAQTYPHPYFWASYRYSASPAAAFSDGAGA